MSPFLRPPMVLILHLIAPIQKIPAPPPSLIICRRHRSEHFPSPSSNPHILAEKSKKSALFSRFTHDYCMRKNACNGMDALFTYNPRARTAFETLPSFVTKRPFFPRSLSGMYLASLFAQGEKNFSRSFTRARVEI